MINGYKIVVVTPAGRKRYMEILIEYILREKTIIDEYQIWVNTKNEDDINYFNYLKEKYPDFITLNLNYLNNQYCGSNSNIGNFLKDSIEENTVYIRLDDDIVWMQEGFIKTISEYRTSNIEPFVVFGTIINNSCIDSILQNKGFYENLPQITFDCLCDNGWKNPYICEEKHKYFLENYLEKNIIIENKFDEIITTFNDVVSINCISWIGDTFKKFNGEINDLEEEVWINKKGTMLLNKNNVIIGNAYCIHYAFWTQREYLDSTNILNRYKKLI